MREPPPRPVGAGGPSSGSAYHHLTSHTPVPKRHRTLTEASPHYVNVTGGLWRRGLGVLRQSIALDSRALETDRDRWTPMGPR